MPAAPLTAGADAPVGMFDSGVGGLSVLRHIRHGLPQEHLLYFADSGYAPYGEKTDAEIVARSLAISEFLLAQGAKALVVACNTATAAAIHALRARYPALILVGIEPGLKPAALHSRNKHVGVLATRSTIASNRFAALRDHLATATGTQFHSAACVGLVDQIEQGALLAPRTAQILHRHLAPMVAQGIDTLVLGCTHYPFVRPLIERILGELGAPAVDIIDTGGPVSRQLVRLLDGAGLRRTAAASPASGTLAAYTSASRSGLENAFARLLGLTPTVNAVGA